MEIRNKEKLRFVYHYSEHTDTFSSGEYLCPSCGEKVFQAFNRTGNSKLPKNMMKFKCIECGTYSILNKENIEKVLGNV